MISCIEVAQAAGLLPGKKVGHEMLFACPRHDDTHPSLAVNLAKNVWLCGPCGRGGNAWELAAWIAGVDAGDKPSVTGWLRGHGLLDGKGEGRIAATYDYLDKDGVLLFQTVRYEPKGFRQRRPDGNGGWIWKLAGIRLVPYRLPKWKDKPIVYIVEGEKDAESLWRIGIPATTSPMGAGKWREEFNEWFTGKRVVILPDNDDAGKKHAQDIARHLFPVVGAIKMVHVPGLPEKGDISFWLERGGTRDQLAKLCSETTALTRKDIDSWQPETRAVAKRIISLADVPGADQIPDVRAEWTVQDFLPKGAIVVLAGEPGSFKSTIATEIGARVTQGEPWAGRKTQEGPVLYLDRENPAGVVRERLAILSLPGSPGLHYWGLWHDENPPALADDRVADFVRSNTGLLIVFDSLIRFHGAKENDSTEMASVMSILRGLAAAGATVLALFHKSDKSETPYRGSSEILAGCDILWAIRRDPEEDIVTLTALKNRFAPETKFTVRLGAEGFEPCDLGAGEMWTATEVVRQIVEVHPGAKKTEIVGLAQGKGLTKRQAERALKSGPFRVIAGAHNAQCYYLAEPEQRVIEI